jgi:hypothetical protein
LDIQSLSDLAAKPFEWPHFVKKEAQHADASERDDLVGVLNRGATMDGCSGACMNTRVV